MPDAAPPAASRRRVGKRIGRPSAAGVVLSLALFGCTTPVVAFRCSVRGHPGKEPRATVTLTNISQKTIASSEVLIDTNRVYPKGGNRLFEIGGDIGPDQTRTIDGRTADSQHYAFKGFKDAPEGCEVESTDFSDGTSWWAPSPM
ncbi:MAG: hypothetical protein ACREM2_08205 [Vulcanimicrobiaceae bacterium]